jgi:hypothetical protein
MLNKNSLLVIDMIPYLCSMKTSTDSSKPARKPQVNLQLEAEEKELFEKVAKAKGNVGVSALLRLLVVEEARRLGIK